MDEKIIGTTIIAIRHKGKIAMAGDGQVTLGNTVMKHGARKVRRLYKDQIIAGFAGWLSANCRSSRAVSDRASAAGRAGCDVKR